MGGSGEYYQRTKFLTEKEVRKFKNRSVATFNSLKDGGIVYSLVCGDEWIGRLDPQRLWARNLIQQQEEKDAETSRPSQDDDPSCHDG